ncbi:teichoic acid biosynthesis protein A [Pseudoalteromonas sp. NCCP-2140]|uniref:WecB/TagA/CpsF family glycosyltransferase n=1 Tax=Pseudoalteromonas sp. NCCP-2140 TaxID=2942288 RepID=UPI00203CB0D3|nr:WecB/TagA/CpsF family glycosyltransferase [Pseudoalteromonas sp. NCCP-2140]GKW54130.1 teichoic acid biosynthesis protein A [Pseudoalteromonas sp. NCCP-2140]
MNQNLNTKLLSGEVFTQTSNQAFESKRSTVISFLNPFSYYEVAKDDNLIDGVDYYFSDGSLLCHLHNLFLPKITRASFDYSSIAGTFLQSVADTNKRIAIIGATEEENTLAVKVLKQQYPGLNVVYHRNGYIENNEQTASELNELDIDVVLVGMGTPYQERFSIYLKDNLKNPAVIITCGGFLTQTSIKPDYYHPLIKKFGLRWLQRIVMHKHVRDRVLKVYPKFIFSYLSTMIRTNAAKK